MSKTLADRRNYAAARAAIEKITAELNELRVNAQEISTQEVDKLEGALTDLAFINDECLKRGN